MKKKKKPLINYRKAIELMRRPGVCLARMHQAGGGFAFYVIPGGEVAAETAAQIKSHPLVQGGADGLWPNHDRTWRMVRAPSNRNGDTHAHEKSH
jgi:hypothetical protein